MVLANFGTRFWQMENWKKTLETTDATIRSTIVTINTTLNNKVMSYSFYFLFRTGFFTFAICYFDLVVSQYIQFLRRYRCSKVLQTTFQNGRGKRMVPAGRNDCEP